MGVDSILGGNFSCSNKRFYKKELHQVQQMLIKHRGYQSQKNWKIFKKRFGKK